MSFSSSLELFPFFDNFSDFNSSSVPGEPLLLCNVTGYLSSNFTWSFSHFGSVLLEIFQDPQRVCWKLSLGWSVLLALVYTGLFLFGFVGNFLVILGIVCKPKMKTATNLFILNLAVADLFVIVFCVPANLFSNLFIPWILGGHLCKVVSYVQGVSVFSSVYSLVAISVERCHVIQKPLLLSRRVSKSHAGVIVLLIWVTGSITTLPWAWVFQQVYYNTSPDEPNFLPFCQEHWSNENHELAYYILCNMFLCYCLPLTLISYFHTIIWKSVLDRSMIPAHSQYPPPRQISLASGSTIAEMHRRTRIRVSKMLTFLTFAFFICWLPLYVIMTWVKVSPGTVAEHADIITIVVPFAQVLGSLNSCVNPILYAFINKKFRDVFKISSGRRGTFPFCRCCPCRCMVAPSSTFESPSRIGTISQSRHHRRTNKIAEDPAPSKRFTVASTLNYEDGSLSSQRHNNKGSTSPCSVITLVRTQMLKAPMATTPPGSCPIDSCL